MRIHVPRLLVYGSLFVAGWLANGVRLHAHYAGQLQLLRELSAENAQAADAAAEMAEQSMEYAGNYQATLDVCLQRLGLPMSKNEKIVRYKQ